jgi:hypothetical protein
MKLCESLKTYTSTTPVNDQLYDSKGLPEMVKTEKTTPKTATIAAKGLRSPKSLTPREIKAVSASALTQTSDRKPAPKAVARKAPAAPASSARKAVAAKPLSTPQAAAKAPAKKAPAKTGKK